MGALRAALKGIVYRINILNILKIWRTQDKQQRVYGSLRWAARQIPMYNNNDNKQHYAHDIIVPHPLHMWEVIHSKFQQGWKGRERRWNSRRAGCAKARKHCAIGAHTRVSTNHYFQQRRFTNVCYSLSKRTYARSLIDTGIVANRIVRHLRSSLASHSNSKCNILHRIARSWKHKP